MATTKKPATKAKKDLSPKKAGAVKGGGIRLGNHSLTMLSVG